MNPPLPKTLHIEDNLRWKKKISKAVFIENINRDRRSNPLLIGNILITMAFSPGIVCAHSKNTGQLLWRFNLNGYGTMIPSLYNKYLYFGTANEIHCVTPKTGKIVWTYRIKNAEGEHSYSNLRFDKNKVFFGDRDGILHCLNANTGSVIWTKKVSKTSLNATPLIIGEHILTCDNGRHFSVLKKEDGSKVWHIKTQASSINPPFIHKKEVIIFSSEEIASISLTKRKVSYLLKLKKIEAVVCSKDKLIVIAKKSFSKADDETKELMIFKNGKMESSTSIGSYLFRMTVLKNSDHICIVGFSDIQIFSIRKNKIIYRLESNLGSLLWPGLPTFNNGMVYIASHRCLLMAAKLPYSLRLQSKLYN